MITDFFILPVLFVLLPGVISASPTWGPHEILRRQVQPTLPLGTLPAQCDSVCNQQAIQTCIPPTADCICAPALQKGYFDCFGCIGNATGETDYTTAQIKIDALTTSCDNAGHDLPKLTFPGQYSNRQLPTSSNANDTAPVTITQTVLPSSPTTSSVVFVSALPISPITVQTMPYPLYGPFATATPTTTATSASRAHANGAVHAMLIQVWFVSMGALIAVVWI